MLAGVDYLAGDVLGVRESVAGRLTSAAARRTDLVSRIVDQIGTAPSLLILDNCEHLVEAVADLVSVLVLRTPSLRVLTTTRAPLGIGAERVYQLPQLGLDGAIRMIIATEALLAIATWAVVWRAHRRPAVSTPAAP